MLNFNLKVTRGSLSTVMYIEKNLLHFVVLCSSWEYRFCLITIIPSTSYKNQSSILIVAEVYLTFVFVLITVFYVSFFLVLFCSVLYCIVL